jgi:hypothetical protein
MIELVVGAVLLLASALSSAQVIVDGLGQSDRGVEAPMSEQPGIGYSLTPPARRPGFSLSLARWSDA